jgi:hypothetical protein
VVTDHAYWRAAERFPGFHTERIEEEILAAFREKRVSPEVPAGIANGSFPGSLYAWTPDGGRVYVLRCDKVDERAFVVITVMDHWVA